MIHLLIGFVFLFHSFFLWGSELKNEKVSIGFGFPDLAHIHYSIKVSEKSQVGLAVGYFTVPGLSFFSKNITADFSDDYQMSIRPKLYLWNSGFFWDWSVLGMDAYLHFSVSGLVLNTGANFFLKKNNAQASMEVVQISASIVQAIYSISYVQPFSKSEGHQWEFSVGFFFLPQSALIFENTGSLMAYMDISPQSAEALGQSVTQFQTELSNTFLSYSIPKILPVMSVKYSW